SFASGSSPNSRSLGQSIASFGGGQGNGMRTVRGRRADRESWRREEGRRGDARFAVVDRSRVARYCYLFQRVQRCFLNAEGGRIDGTKEAGAGSQESVPFLHQGRMPSTGIRRL